MILLGMCEHLHEALASLGLVRGSKQRGFIARAVLTTLDAAIDADLVRYGPVFFTDQRCDCVGLQHDKQRYWQRQHIHPTGCRFVEVDQSIEIVVGKILANKRGNDGVDRLNKNCGG